MKKRAFVVCAFAFLFFTLFFGMRQWFSDLENQAKIGESALFSEPLDLSRVGSTTWTVPRSGWLYEEGETRLSLVLTKSQGAQVGGGNRSSMPLRLKVSAKGIGEHGKSFDRLVQNWYFTTDKPFDPDAKLWSSFGGNEAEYGLAGVNVYPFETTSITVEVTNPDPSFANEKPRLKLVGKHDYAVYEIVPLLRVFKYLCFIVSVALVFILSYLVWRKN